MHHKKDNLLVAFKERNPNCVDCVVKLFDIGIANSPPAPHPQDSFVFFFFFAGAESRIRQGFDSRHAYICVNNKSSVSLNAPPLLSDYY